ncbi:MAG: hypothetical protein AB8H86_30585 [Polyangiales bacterium]
MKVCPECHKSNQDHYAHCLGCGASLEAPSGPEDNAVSPNAGKELSGFERWMRHLAGIFGI